MKNLVIMLLAVVMMTATANANDLGKKKTTTVFNVSMDCQNCVDKVQKNIAFEKGVKDLKIDLEKKTVAVTYLNNKTDVNKLNAAFQKLGFTSSVVEDCCGEAKEGENCDEVKEGECSDQKKGEECCDETKTIVKKKIKR